MRFFPLVAAYGVGAAVIREQLQVPILEHIESTTQRLEEEDSDRPSIAVHFTSSHAIPAARFPNGTVLDLATVAGDVEYIDLMSRWVSKKSSSSRQDRSPRQDWCETHPHYEECKAYTAQGLRQDDFEDPASRDAAILSKLLMQVRLSVEGELDIKMTTIGPAMFQLNRDETNIIHHAMELVGLPSTSYTYYTTDLLLDTVAAYVGTGAVFCKTWMDPEKCRLEGSETRQRTVLFLDFDNHSFSASIRHIQHEDTSHPVGPSVQSSILGWWSLPVFEVPRAKFWARIHEAILDVVGTLSEPFDRIILMGEHGADEEFRGVVETVIWNALEMDVGSMLQYSKPADAGRIAARGAAEMAWRREYWRREAEVSERD